jgi:hypothetical protein
MPRPSRADDPALNPDLFLAVGGISYEDGWIAGAAFPPAAALRLVGSFSTN